VSEAYHTNVGVVDDRLIYAELVHELNGVRETIIRGMIDTQDRLVREKLIALGWTPPVTLGEANEIMAKSGECGPMSMGVDRVCVDGIYTLHELEAILVIARRMLENQEAQVTAG
jgi:hypothetical protein